MARHTVRADRIERVERFAKKYLIYRSRSSYHALEALLTPARAAAKTPLTRDRLAQYLFHHLHALKSNQYIHRPQHYRDLPPPSWVHDESLLTEREFKAVYRMSKASFDALVDQIHPHPVFYSDSYRNQRPPKF
jgi:hypothetical protein